MPDDYAYINTRVRAMRANLMDGRTLESALAAGSYPEFLRVLSETEMAARMRETSSQDAGLAELDSALSKELFATTQKVLGFSEGRSRKEIELLLMKWDLANLKTLVRGILSGRGSETLLQSLVPGGTIKPAVFQAAANATDLSSAAATLAVTGHPLAKALRQHVSGNTALLDLEIALDQAYYRHALKESQDNALKTYLSREIDITNAMIVRANKVVNPAFFVPGGRIKAADYARLGNGNDGGQAHLAPILDAPTLEEAEVAARSALDKASYQLMISDGEGVGVVLDFLRRKEMEIAKLRLIGRGKFYQLPTEVLRKEIGA